MVGELTLMDLVVAKIIHDYEQEHGKCIRLRDIISEFPKYDHLPLPQFNSKNPCMTSIRKLRQAGLMPVFDLASRQEIRIERTAYSAMIARLGTDTGSWPYRLPFSLSGLHYEDANYGF